MSNVATLSDLQTTVLWNFMSPSKAGWFRLHFFRADKSCTQPCRQKQNSTLQNRQKALWPHIRITVPISPRFQSRGILLPRQRKSPRDYPLPSILSTDGLMAVTSWFSCWSVGVPSALLPDLLKLSSVMRSSGVSWVTTPPFLYSFFLSTEGCPAIEDAFAHFFLVSIIFPFFTLPIQRSFRNPHTHAPIPQQPYTSRLPSSGHTHPDAPYRLPSGHKDWNKEFCH